MGQLSLFRDLFLHSQNLWSLHDNEAHTPKPQKGALPDEAVEKHFAGEHTISFQLLQPGTNQVKVGVFDVDAPKNGDETGLKKAFKTAQKLKNVAQTWNVTTYLEYSGRRGFHVWVFCNGLVDAASMRRMLQFFAMSIQDSDGCHIEVFPYGDEITILPDGRVEGSAYKPMKIPCGVHQQGGWSGFIDWECEDISQMEIVPAEQFLKNIKRVSPQLIIEVASLFHDQGIEYPDKQDYEFSRLQGRIPDCLANMIRFGVPDDMEYNQANMSLARYVCSVKMKEEDALRLGQEMAKNTDKAGIHHTSKGLRDKIADFKGVYKHVVKNVKKYQWSCLYIFASRFMVKNKWCTAWDCPLYPYEVTKDIELPEATIAHVSIEREVIAYILHHADTIIDITGIEIVPTEGFIVKEEIADEKKSRIPIYQWLYEVCSFLLGSGKEIRESTLLEVFQSHSKYSKFNPSLLNLVSQRYKELKEQIPCSTTTFKELLQKIHEQGLRIVSRRDIAAASHILSEPKKNIAESISIVEQLYTKVSTNPINLDSTMSFASRIPGLLRELRNRNSKTISTGFSELDKKFSGGLLPRFYVVAGTPGSGKTTLALQMGINAAMNGIPTLMLQYEMSTQEIYAKLCSYFTEIDSMIIDTADWNSPDGALKMDIIEKTSAYIAEHAAAFHVIQCGEQDNIYTIRAKIKWWRDSLMAKQKLFSTNGHTPEQRFLLIVDSVNHVLTGNPKLDADETQRSAWVGTELARITRPDDMNAAVFGLTEVTKQGFEDAYKTGRLHMGSIRGSFRVAHSGHVVVVLRSGITEKGKNQLEIVYPNNEEIRDRIKDKYPITDWMKQQYVCLDIVKNRSGMVGSVLLYHLKGMHKFHGIDIYPDNGNDSYQQNHKSQLPEGTTEENALTPDSVMDDASRYVP